MLLERFPAIVPFDDGIARKYAFSLREPVLKNRHNTRDFGLREVFDGAVPDHIVETTRRYFLSNVGNLELQVWQGVVPLSMGNCLGVKIHGRQRGRLFAIKIVGIESIAA